MIFVMEQSVNLKRKSKRNIKLQKFASKAVVPLIRCSFTELNKLFAVLRETQICGLELNAAYSRLY